MDDWNVVGEPTLREVSSHLWLAEGHVPRMTLGRWMTIAKRDDGRLVIHNAVALPEAQMQRIEAWGEVAYIVVPNRFHRIDAARFHARYPEAKIVCPPGARAKVQERVPVGLTYDDFPDDDAVGFEPIGGIADGEGAMRVCDGDGVTLAFTDVLFNLPHHGGFGGFMVRLMGSSGGPKVTRVFRMVAVKDKEALRESLRRLAAIEGLRRLIPGHGRVIEDDAPQVLRTVADQL